MTDATALAQLLRSHFNEPWMTIGGRPFAAEAAALLDSLSQRLAAAERERDGYMKSAELHYKIRCDQEQNSSNLADQLAAAERRNAELTKHVEDRENCCRQLLDTYAARQHELEQENAKLARHEEAVKDAVTLLLACLIFLPPISLSNNVSSLYGDIDKWLARNRCASQEPPTS